MTTIIILLILAGITDLEYLIDINSKETVTISKEEYEKLKNANNYSTK